jgi:hypothetical protein
MSQYPEGQVPVQAAPAPVQAQAAPVQDPSAPAAAPVQHTPAHGHGTQDIGGQLTGFVQDVTQFKIHPETAGAQPWSNQFWSFYDPVETCKF